MRIGIAGVGGIGSNVAVNLVRSGVDYLKLVDFDRIELSNLNRQFYFYSQIGQFKVEMLEKNLIKINPGLMIDRINLKLCRENLNEVFENCEIIIEGFDVESMKKDILENFAGEDKLIISACGIAGNQLNNIKTRKIGNAYIVGDFTSDHRDYSLYFPKINIIASMMSDIALREKGIYESNLSID